MSYKRFVKYLLNIIVILLWIIVYYLQFEYPFITRTAQNISPSLLVTTIPHTLFWLCWISAPLFLFAVLKGRFFCRHICPMGLLQDLMPSLGRAKAGKGNRYIFLGLFAAAIFGFNLLAIFDPLVNFNAALISLSQRLIIFFIISGSIILLSLYKKRLWCFKLCPLGAFFDLAGLKKIDLDKRRTLISLGTGLIFGGLFKIKNIRSAPVHDRLLRPPGALPEDKFTDRCIRCGSCMAVCLTKTLTPVFLESGAEGIFTPKLVPQIAECDEYCNKCGASCPTQAIKNLPLAVKRNFKIGTIKINRSICISWRNEGLCMICQEHCPYLAIDAVRNESGNPCPKELPEVCRGCGICEKYCPTRPIRAILVYNDGAGRMIYSSDKNPNIPPSTAPVNAPKAAKDNAVFVFSS